MEVRETEDGSQTAVAPSLNKCLELKFQSKENPNSQEQTIYVVGTAHVSRSSCDAVERIIRHVKPDAVFLELCEGRKNLLNPAITSNQGKPMSLSDVIAVWKSGKGSLFEVLYCWMLERFGSELEVAPGEEFRVAFQEARKLNAIVMLGDRPVLFFSKVPPQRVWIVAGVNIPDKEEMMKLFDEWEDTDAMTEAIRELSKHFPSLAVHLIYERDLFMIHSIRELAARATTIVAVVGAGHMPGIRANWDEEIDIEALSTVIPRKPSSIWKYILLASSSMLVFTVGYLRFRTRN